MVHVVIAAQYFVIPFLPIFKCMAGRAQPNDWLAGTDVLLDARKLLFRQRHAADEQDREVGAVEGLKAGNVVAAAPPEIGAVKMVVRFKEFFEDRQAVGREVLILAGDQDDIWRAFW